MNRFFSLALVIAASYVAVTSDAAAHIVYKDIQTLGTATVNPDGSTRYALLGALNGNGAWANATDADWGNSHDIPWYKFSVTNPSGAYVTLSVAGGVTSVSGITVLGDLTPAFSLYSGLLPIQAHDGAASYPIPFDKDGGWLALADTTLGNDAGDVGTIEYIGHAGSVDGTDQTVSLVRLLLGQGAYTVALGGACYECFPHYERLDPSNPAYDPNYENLIIDIENDAGTKRGYSMNLTIQAVPVPAAIWFLGSGLIGLGIRARKART
jgi:hypothetical protein